MGVNVAVEHHPVCLAPLPAASPLDHALMLMAQVRNAAVGSAALDHALAPLAAAAAVVEDAQAVHAPMYPNAIHRVPSVP